MYQRMVAEGEKIARVDRVTGDAYNTWSLFIVCNPDWLDQRGRERLEMLFHHFKLFGKVIGRRHLAVWFGTDIFAPLEALSLTPPRFGAGGVEHAGTQHALGEPVTEDASTQETHEEERSVVSLDVTRNVDFCEKYHLLPSESPHIIITTKDPNLEVEVGDFWNLSLAGQSERNIRALLTKLADQILVQGLDQSELGSEQWWRSWYSIMDHAIQNTSEALSNIKVSIKTSKFGIEAQYDRAGRLSTLFSR